MRLRYRTRLESFADTGDGVTAEIVDLESGKREQHRGRLSRRLRRRDERDPRRSSASGSTGQGVLGHPVHLFFRAPDFLKRVGKAEGTFFLAIDRGGLWANIRVVDPANAMWRLMVLDSDGRQTPESIDKDALIRRAVGRPFEVEWLGCSIWTRRSVVAEKYYKGRVFLAGDAVHQLSPTGAIGMNTGIGDVVDLGWKLAAVVQGWGGPNLLASYDSERQPIGLRAIDKTAGFHLAHGKFDDGFAAIEDDSDQGRALRADLGPQLVREVGAHVPHHRPAAWLSLRGFADRRARRHAAVPDDPENFVASARPGSRAPHVALADGRSMLDLYGRGFVLVRLRCDAPDGAAIRRAAAQRGVPLRTVTIEEPEAAEIYETQARAGAARRPRRLARRRAAEEC